MLLREFPLPGRDCPPGDGNSFLCPRELVKKQGCGYDFTFLENESTILLFLAKRENDFTISEGREYDFTIQVPPEIAIIIAGRFLVQIS